MSRQLVCREFASNFDFHSSWKSPGVCGQWRVGRPRVPTRARGWTDRAAVSTVEDATWRRCLCLDGPIAQRVEDLASECRDAGILVDESEAFSDARCDYWRFVSRLPSPSGGRLAGSPARRGNKKRSCLFRACLELSGVPFETLEVPLYENDTGRSHSG